ncbi:MAG: YiiX family permuted papain-like enzyme [Bacteroidetes bacterium]|nr:YiiX family permuted papain-like enzyme [Bacteroidota bacterium]
MKTFIKLFFIDIMLCLFSEAQITDYKKKDVGFREGDIIFQSNDAGQGLAIKLATHSQFTHCGIVFKDNEKWYVLEAIQPVCVTPLQDWIARGDDGFYKVMRLQDESRLDEATHLRMKTYGKKLVGKNYDFLFGWSDEKLYCSELVWKIYKTEGIEVGKLQQLKEFDLTHPIVKNQLYQRFNHQVPLEEKVISPQAIYESKLLKPIN